MVSSNGAKSECSTRRKHPVHPANERNERKKTPRKTECQDTDEPECGKKYRGPEPERSVNALH